MSSENQHAARPGAEQAQKPSDSTLVDRARAGDAAAFELIMRRYNRLLYRLGRGIVRREAEAEEIVQETYLRAFARLGDFRGPQGFSAWLCRIAVNEALARQRRSGRIVSFSDYVEEREGRTLVEQMDTMTATQPDPERLTASGELRGLLEGAIDALPEDFRVVFVLRAIEGLSVAETAEALALRPETVKTRFHRARNALQASLTARIGDELPAMFQFAGARCDRIVAAVLEKLDL